MSMPMSMPEAVNLRYFIKDVLKNFTNFQGKHLLPGSLFNNVVGCRPEYLSERDSSTIVFK